MAKTSLVAGGWVLALLAACGGQSSSPAGSSAGSTPPASPAPQIETRTDMVTYKDDAQRTGADPTESVLTPANVNPATFGLLHNFMVDGKVDAEPLYLSQLSIGGAPHDVVFVATEGNSVYAFDTDSGAMLWHVSLTPSGEMTSDDHGCSQITPAIGITSTPVIDRNAGPHGTLFTVSMTEDASANYHQRLHALDLTTGAELAESPVEITASYGSTSFAPGQYAERAALLLVNGTIYTAWTSHCDAGPYGGWIIAYGESSLARTGVLNVAPGASGSGFASEGPSIWMAGGGPAADASGNVYVLTGNGRFETTLDANGLPSGGDYGNSFVKVSSAGGAPAVADYFAMSNELSESGSDSDLGSGGVMLLPNLTDASGTVRQLAVGAGKDGNIYVVDRNSMGKFNASANDIWQELDGVLPGGVFSNPAYFNGTVYYGPVGSSLLAFSVVNAKLSAAPTSQSSTQFAYPGSSPVVSANGTSDAIVWAYENSSPAVLHAYNATNLAMQLYDSSQAANGRDQFGAGNKFIVPAVADGKVFVASTDSVAEFGLLP
ncbi:MAG: pyrrolo-quinoline quinone [Steroidobacteraceae bacterium]